jgi:RNase P protein component
MKCILRRFNSEAAASAYKRQFVSNVGQNGKGVSQILVHDPSTVFGHGQWVVQVVFTKTEAGKALARNYAH